MQPKQWQRRAQVLVWYGLLLPIILCACGSPSKSAEFGTGLPKVTPTPQVHGLEHRMFALLNNDRVANKLPRLQYDERLADIGRAHSTDMRDHSFFDHVSPTYGNLEARVDRAGYRSLVARENLAEAPDVAKAEANLLASPHHYENIMATDITHVGIGLVKGGVKDKNNLTITQVFATPGRTETETEVIAAVQSKIRRARDQNKLAPATQNPRLSQHADEQLRGSLQDSDDPDLKAIAAAISKRLAKEPVSGVRGISVASQVMVDSTQFEVPAALMRERRIQYGIAVGYARPKGKRPVLKILMVVGL